VTRKTTKVSFGAGMFGVVEDQGVLAPECDWAIVYAQKV